MYTTTTLKPCLQEPCPQDSEIWFSFSPANHSIMWGLQAGGHQQGMGAQKWVEWGAQFGVEEAGQEGSRGWSVPVF